MDFGIDQLPLKLSVPVRLALGAWNDQAFHDNVEEVVAGLGPILQLLTFIGCAPKTLRVNPRDDLPSFRVDFLPTGEMEIVPEVEKATGQEKRFDFYTDAPANVDGVEIDFHLSSLPFYAADNMRLWWDLTHKPGNTIYSADAIAWGWEAEEDTGEGVEGVWQFLTQNISGPEVAPPANAQPNAIFATRIERAATDFVIKFIEKLALDAQSRSDSYMCSIGLSGLIFDPDNWLHSFRWRETGPMRLSRVRLVDTIGRLIWRGLTGPDLTSGGTVPPSNSTDGPNKIKAFLYEEILGTDIDGATPVAKRKTAWDWSTDGIESHWARVQDLPDDDPGNLFHPMAEAAQFLKLLEVKLTADYVRMKVIDDGTFVNTPPPKAAAIRKLSLP